MVQTAEDLVIACLRRYAYGLVEEFVEPDSRLLDVGFGEGFGSEIVRPHVREYIGVDVDRDAVEHATRTYSDPGVSFVHYDGVVLPFADDSFQVVISFQVIEHVRDVLGYLQEIGRVSAPGATVLIVTPNRNHRLEDGERPWNRYHVREFSPSELTAEMELVFADVQLLGIHGSTAMEQIERARVARTRRLVRLDPLGVRYVLPEALDHWLRSVLRRRQSTVEPVPEIDVRHMYHSAAGVEVSLDLLAIARIPV
jgi:SAM-dependent methyltransferase